MGFFQKAVCYLRNRFKNQDLDPHPHSRPLANSPLADKGKWDKLNDLDRSLVGMKVSPEAIHQGLRSNDSSEVVLALEVIRTLVSRFPKEASEFSAEVLSLTKDPRIEKGPIGVRLCARAREVHSLLFFNSPEKGAWDALREVIESMISAGLGISLGMHFRALKANSIPADLVGDFLLKRMEDPSAPVKVRLQAREALAALATEGGSQVRNQALPSPEGKAAMERANDFLLTALENPEEPEEFKAGIRSALTQWMPHRIDQLRGTIIPSTSVPSIEDLSPGQSPAGIDPEELFSLLRDSNASLGRVLSAIALVESFLRLKPESAPLLEPLLRERISDHRYFIERGRKWNVGMQALYSYQKVWSYLKDSFPGEKTLSLSLGKIAASQEAPGPGESSLAYGFAAVIVFYLEKAGMKTLIADLLEGINDSNQSTWTRLHFYHALNALKQGDLANQKLFVALSDPKEDPVLRKEAHSLLALQFKAEIFDLQKRELLFRPPLPPVEKIYEIVPLFERDTEGALNLTPEAFKLMNLFFPEDLIDALKHPDKDPSRSCSAAVFAAKTAERLPQIKDKIIEALRSARLNGKEIQLDHPISGKNVTFRLETLCNDALKELKAG